MRKIIVLTVFLCAGLVWSGCSMKSQNDVTFDELAYGDESAVSLSSQQHEQVADGFMRRSSPEMALLHYNKAIQMDDTNMEARIKRGNLLAEQGMDEQALLEFNNVLKQDPDNPLANQGAGGVYFRAGLYSEARMHLQKALQLNPILWEAQNYLGVLCNREGDYENAAKHFSRALELHQGDDSGAIYNNLGVVHIALHQYPEAVEAFRLALKTGGVSTRTYNNLGLALARLDRLEEALESFKYAGGEAKAYNNLGYVLLTDNQPGKAVSYFEKAIELSPSYYVKAAENLKRARLAAKFQETDQQPSGSTPNPLLRKSFPDSKQTPGGPAASPASAGSPSSVIYQKVSLEKPGAGVPDIRVQVGYDSYGLHVSSWRTHKKAFSQCALMRERGFDPWINQVDLGKKGIWYRVLVGNYPTVTAAKRDLPSMLAAFNLKRMIVFRRVVPKLDGTHL